MEHRPRGVTMVTMRVRAGPLTKTALRGDNCDRTEGSVTVVTVRRGGGAGARRRGRCLKKGAKSSGRVRPSALPW
ncbi:hypothetical protein chiPu_0004280 [Chiloscyllium punctatum]|uniref:Uncharacterized protein n=1 Tax=Chiloscyllium punctatum TaxID=137246 RepID=A0A401S660_CHIPU|nr:hypothetical protein [Chiloscyllium punctatum]